MIVNINQCASMYDETLNVLKFSAVAQKVQTRFHLLSMLCFAFWESPLSYACNCLELCYILLFNILYIFFNCFRSLSRWLSCLPGRLPLSCPRGLLVRYPSSSTMLRQRLRGAAGGALWLAGILAWKTYRWGGVWVTSWGFCFITISLICWCSFYLDYQLK